MKTKAKILAISHLIILLILIYWNYYSNTGAVNDTTVGEISDKFDNLFTPASYAFSIWGIIYTGLLVFGIYLVKDIFTKQKTDEIIRATLPTLSLAHIGSGVWLWFWLHEQSGLSTIIMVFILISLVWTYIRLDEIIEDRRPAYNVLMRTPVGLYAGWISVATIANIAAHLGSLDMNYGLSEMTWTVIAIGLATTLALLMVFGRILYMLGAVAAIGWALLAIAIRHQGSLPTLYWSALIGIAIIGAGALFRIMPRVVGKQ